MTVRQQVSLPADRAAPDVYGRASALTVLSPLRPWGELWLRPLFWLLRAEFTLYRRFGWSPSLTPLLNLGFIHFGHWHLIPAKFFAKTGNRQSTGVRHTYLLFESNFDGTFDQYIGAFSEILPQRLSLIWSSSYGFPRPVPVEQFKAYIRRNEYHTAYYWSAYPEATTKTIASGLAIAKAIKAFRKRAHGLSGAAYDAAYADFLGEIQTQL